MKISITLNLIRMHSPCHSGWEKLLKSLGKEKADDAPLHFSDILKSNGLDDALWCLRALPQEHKEKARLLACDFAERVLNIYEKKHPKDERVRNCIATARKFALGEVSLETMDAARAAAGDAAGDAAWDAAWDAAGAAARAAAGAAAWDAAWDAAGDAAGDAARAAAGAAAWDAAGDAEQKAQAELLLKYFG